MRAGNASGLTGTQEAGLAAIETAAPALPGTRRGGGGLSGGEEASGSLECKQSSLDIWTKVKAQGAPVAAAAPAGGARLWIGCFSRAGVSGIRGR